MGVLKEWITHAEATEVHMVLDTFRDDANFVRGLRAAASLVKQPCSSTDSSSSASEASVKNYLFLNSIGQTCEVYTMDDDSHKDGQDAENGDPQEDEDAQVPESSRTHRTKVKASHHQRRRRGKF